MLNLLGSVSASAQPGFLKVLVQLLVAVFLTVTETVCSETVGCAVEEHSKSSSNVKIKQDDKEMCSCPLPSNSFSSAIKMTLENRLRLK